MDILQNPVERNSFFSLLSLSLHNFQHVNLEVGKVLDFCYF